MTRELTEQNRDKIDNSLKQVVARENVHGGRVEEKQEKDKSRQQNEKKKKRKNTETVSTIDIKV
jgi:hypothetical protein